MYHQFGSLDIGKTKALKKTGATGTWLENDLVQAPGWKNPFPIDENQKNVELIAQVYDGYNYMGDTFIGKVALSIEPAFSGKPTTLEGNLESKSTFGKVKITGKISVKVIMEGPLVVAEVAEKDAEEISLKEEKEEVEEPANEKEDTTGEEPAPDNTNVQLAEPSEAQQQKMDESEEVSQASVPTAPTAPGSGADGPTTPKQSPRGRSPRPSMKDKNSPRQSSEDLENGGTVIVKSIEVKNLPKSVSGMFDVNDPYVTLRFGDNDCVNKTKTQDNAGEQARWDKLYFEVEVTKEGLREKSLNLKVYDDNYMSDKFIGEAFMKLDNLMNDVGKDIETEFIDIFPTDKKGAAREKSSGQIKLKLRLQPNPPKIKAETPLNLKDLEAIPLDNGAVIHIDKIICKSLTNVDFLGKNDPLVQFHFGKQEKKISTSTRTDAGSESNWDETDEMDLKIVVTKNDIIREHNALHVEVFDYNYTGNKLIGKTRVDVKKLMLNIDKKIDIPRFHIYRSDEDKEKGKKSGEVELTLRLTEKPANMVETEDSEEIIQIERVKPELLEGIKLRNGAILKIDRIVAKDLVNVELAPLDKNDPFVIVKLGEKGNDYKTDTKDNAGDYADWENVNLEIETYKDQLTTEKLNVKVYDENITAKKLIGETDLILDALLLKVGQQQELPMTIIRDTKGKNTCSLSIHICMYPFTHHSI